MLIKAKGIHCQSCEILIRNRLNDVGIVENVTVNIPKQTLEIPDQTDENRSLILQNLQEGLGELGYKFSVIETNTEENKPDYKLGVIIIGISTLAIILLNNSLSQLVTITENSFLTTFILGVFASLSSCSAVVGGILLTYSKTANLRKLTIFHLSRILSFLTLGGILGLVGQSVGINIYLNLILNIIIGVFLGMYGLNMLGITLLGKFMNSQKVLDKVLVNQTGYTFPVIFGILTFFLPCGFTQSVQLLALQSRSWIEGGLMLFTFALGTFPILGLISFFGLKSSKVYRHQKTINFLVGITLIILGTYNLYNSMISLIAILGI